MRISCCEPLENFLPADLSKHVLDLAAAVPWNANFVDRAVFPGSLQVVGDIDCLAPLRHPVRFPTGVPRVLRLLDRDLLRSNPGDLKNTAHKIADCEWRMAN